MSQVLIERPRCTLRGEAGIIELFTCELREQCDRARRVQGKELKIEERVGNTKAIFATFRPPSTSMFKYGFIKSSPTGTHPVHQFVIL